MFSPMHPIIANLFGRAPFLKMMHAPRMPSDWPKEASRTTHVLQDNQMHDGAT